MSAREVGVSGAPPGRLKANGRHAGDLSRRTDQEDGASKLRVDTLISAFRVWKGRCEQAFLSLPAASDV